MAKRSSPKISFEPVKRKLQSQFRNINPNDPASWPALPQFLLFMTLAAAIVTALWFAWLTDSDAQLESERAKEVVLRADFKQKLAKAVNLDALKKQREQVQQYVFQLEKQLPSKAEMDALLSDINQAGLGRSLHFELFRPGQVSVKTYYAELPIALRVVGGYHDVGAFAADIANLSRIVTLGSVAVGPGRDGTLVLDATAKTYRYLDPDEVAAQQKAAPPGGAKK